MENYLGSRCVVEKRCSQTEQLSVVGLERETLMGKWSLHLEKAVSTVCHRNVVLDFKQQAADFSQPGQRKTKSSQFKFMKEQTHILGGN